MGSITKKPKAPVIQYVVPRQSVATPTTIVEPTEPQKTDDEIKSEARTESLLRRSRGRLGTIATSFRGFLDSASGNDNQQKTLLGE